MPPGHTPEAEAGTEFIQFSPADQLAATEAAIARALRSEQPVTETRVSPPEMLISRLRASSLGSRWTGS